MEQCIAWFKVPFGHDTKNVNLSLDVDDLQLQRGPPHIVDCWVRSKPAGPVQIRRPLNITITEVQSVVKSELTIFCV